MEILGNEWALARPSKAQYEWQDYELGMFIHWMPYYGEEISFLNSPELRRDEEYQKAASYNMKMSKMDTDQWVRSAVDLGAKYVVFVAKHNKGFVRWQTDTNYFFSMKYSQYKHGKGDIVLELSESCKKYGVKLGIYMCGDSLACEARQGGITTNPNEQDWYTNLYRQWLTEIFTRYGSICEIWFDSSLKIDVRDIIGKYAPNAMVFQSPNATIRWVGNEEGWAYYPAWNSIKRYDAISGIATQYHSDPDGDNWMPLECDVPIRDSWVWNPNPSNKLRTLDELMEMYYKSVGRGTTLLINQGPHPEGYIIDEDFNRMKEFGDEIRRRFDNPIAETSGEGEFVEIDLGKAQPVDHVVLMEDTRCGERIRKYVIEGFDGQKWIQFANGSSVGHKKIDFFPAANVSKVRFRGLVAVGQPIIRSMKVYNVGTIPQGFTNNDEE